MKIATLALSLLAGIGTVAAAPPAPPVSMSALPNCFDANYDTERGLFTMKNAAGNAVNQQCLLTVWPRGDAASASRLTAGSYAVSLSNGGGGGAGGTVEAFAGGGGGGGGGAGAMETKATLDLTEGVYKLTLGAGGPGGSGCIRGPQGFDGGPGWLGSPSNIVRVATGEVVVGTPGADTYARPSRSQNERTAGKKRDGHGGSGPGQASGGQGGGLTEALGRTVKVEAAPGASASGVSGGAVGLVPKDEPRAGSGGGGGATNLADGGDGGGALPRHKDVAPERGSLGSGGGGGGGNLRGCAAGAQGGHGFIALRPI